MSSRIGKAVLGYGIPLALLVWIFHDLDWHEAITSLRGLRWSTSWGTSSRPCVGERCWRRLADSLSSGWSRRSTLGFS
jgi:hypothetical protein